MRFTSALLLACASLAHVGCSFATDFDDFEITGEEVSPEYAAFRDELAAKLCAREISCSGKNSATPSSSACAHVPGTARTSLFEHYLASIAPRGNDNFVSSSATTCLGAITVGRCEFELLPRACDFLMVGTRPNGASCSGDTDCVSTQCVGEATTCGTRVCAPLGAVATDCADDRDCGIGLICLAGACAQPVAIGNPCTQDDECGNPLLWCNDATGQCASRPSIDGATCGAPRTIDPCIGDLRCFGGTCISGGGAGAPCNPGTCRVGFGCYQFNCREIRTLGMACGDANEEALCASGLTCTTDAVCRPPAPVETEPCTTTCAVGNCVDGTCRLASLGETCRGTGSFPPAFIPVCDEGHCGIDSTACDPLLEAGSPCTTDAECLSGTCRGEPGSKTCVDCSQ